MGLQLQEEDLETNLSVLIFGQDTHQLGNTSILKSRSVLKDINAHLNVFVLPFVILVGVIGNVFSLLVFRSPVMRRQTTSVYLASLACSDTGFLLCLFIVWLSWLRIDIFHRHFWCVVVVYFSYVCGFLSVWLIVAFTVERFLCIYFPLRRRHIANTKRAKIVVCLLTIFSLGAYSFATWTSGIVIVNEREVCAPYSWQFRTLSILTHVDTAVTLVVPSLLIITLNTAIVYRIYRFQRRTLRGGGTRGGGREDGTDEHALSPVFDASRSEAGTAAPLVQSMEDRGVRPQHPTSAADGGRRRTRLKSTRILLAICSVFIILNLPSHALRVRICIMEFTFPDHIPSLNDIQYRQMADFIYYLNFTLNVFLYSLCGEHFRKTLCVILRNLKTNFIQCLCYDPPVNRIN